MEYEDIQFIPSEPHENPTRRLFGHFPGLYAAHPEVLQGFQWKPTEEDSLNISNIRELTLNPIGAEARTLARTQRALDALHMGDASEAVYVVPDRDDDSIVFLTKKDLKQRPHALRGIIVKAAGVFNNLGVTEYAPLNDCAWPMVVGFAKDKPPMVGFIHIGRRRAIHGLPANVVQGFEDKGYAVTDMYMCIPPSLEQDRHSIQAADALSQLGNIMLWGEFIRYEHDQNVYYPDNAGKVAADFLAAGIPPDHIEVYRVGTYEGAEQGFGGSYRHMTVSGEPGSAFLFGVKVDNSQTNP